MNLYSELLKEIDTLLKAKNREIELQQFQIEQLQKKIQSYEGGKELSGYIIRD